MYIILWITSLIFRCANTVFGAIGEHNMKPNMKDLDRRTRYQDGQKYSILFKQYESIYYMLVIEHSVVHYKLTSKNA